MAKKKEIETQTEAEKVETKKKTDKKTVSPKTKAEAAKKAAPAEKEMKVLGTVDRDKVLAEVFGYDPEYKQPTPVKKASRSSKPKKPAAKKANKKAESSVQLEPKLKAIVDELILIAKESENGKLNQTDLDEKVMENGVTQEENEKILIALSESDIEVIDDLSEDFNFEAATGTSFDRDEKVGRDSRSDITQDPVKQYLREIGQIPLLSGEQEIMIAQRITKGIRAKEILDADKQRKPSDPEKLSEAEIIIYEEEKNDGENAKKALAESNLRLVVSIAKKYTNRGMQFLDLIQEGNLGLLKAVDKYDYTRGFKFSTYATWWIRQAITRSIADQGRTIRIPVHMVETINKVKKASAELLHELDREPRPEEIAQKLGMSPEKVQEVLRVSQEPVSLETPIGEEEDSHLGDFIPDEDSLSPADVAAQSFQKSVINEVLHTLTDREREVIQLRFGLVDGDCKTLEEVGDRFNVTRERIRQIEAKALRKLRHPSRSKRLKDL